MNWVKGATPQSPHPANYNPCLYVPVCICFEGHVGGEAIRSWEPIWPWMGIWDAFPVDLLVRLNLNNPKRTFQFLIQF